MIDLFNRLFGRQNSSTTAKERLRLVLLSDHLSLAPELVDDLKRELIDVLSRYVEVDRSKIEVNFEQHDRSVAMMANIPILSMHPPKDIEPPKNSGGGGGGGTLVAEKSVAPALQVQSEVPKKPRRRRKRSPATSNPAPAT
ncbi:MAG: cell division topological specificity factor MinE [Candidatus Eremiobacteraeota bacterium]|nr:cell division topological specificity factor MinE [Candidatus Eremiobacteraeota bacterium]